MIAAIVIFLLVITLHEFGHFIVAKMVGMRVNEFSIGMGPLILKKDTEETQYSLRLLPIGGYVALEGEDESSDDPRSFSNMNAPSKLAVLFAGAGMNFVLAVIAFIILGFLVGSETNSVGAINESSPAQMAGLQVGDEILSIDGVETPTWKSITNVISNSEKSEIEIVINRDGVKQSIMVEPTTIEGRNAIGITSLPDKSASSAFKYGFTKTKDVVIELYGTLWKLVTGKMNLDVLSGPVGVIKMISYGASQGIVQVVLLLGAISANLGVMNLLPLPALDGGKILVIILESIFRRKLPEKFEYALNGIGFALLIGLMLFITFRNDIKLGW